MLTIVTNIAQATEKTKIDAKAILINSFMMLLYLIVSILSSVNIARKVKFSFGFVCNVCEIGKSVCDLRMANYPRRLIDTIIPPARENMAMAQATID